MVCGNELLTRRHVGGCVVVDQESRKAGIVLVCLIVIGSGHLIGAYLYASTYLILSQFICIRVIYVVLYFIGLLEQRGKKMSNFRLVGVILKLESNRGQNGVRPVDRAMSHVRSVDRAMPKPNSFRICIIHHGFRLLLGCGHF